MLVIVSDIHLQDGTLASSISPTACTRPWIDAGHPNLTAMLSRTTNAILDLNAESLAVLRQCANAWSGAYM